MKRAATLRQVQAVDRGIELLCEARELFKRADSPKTLERIRLALSSAKGARRHIGHRQWETEKGQA
jgi:hypothetical protein